MDEKNNHRYDDILHLPHPSSRRHPRMPRSERAAQFVPFSALGGYDAAVKETARLTQERRELGDWEQERLSHWLSLLHAAPPGTMQVTVTYFVEDGKKSGGAYRSFSGTVKRVDQHERRLLFEQGPSVAFEDLMEIEGARRA